MISETIEQLATSADLLRTMLLKMHDGLRRTYPPVSRYGSQNEEDQILASLLPGDAGTYVDVGAGEPIQCSNTWQFYKRGWRGLLIEPLEIFHAALLANRPGDFLWPLAALDYDGFTPFRVSGTVSSVLASWNILASDERIIPCERLSTMLSRFSAIRDRCRLCTIDVEGAEGFVLQGIDWTAFHPEVLCIEYITYDPKEPGADISGEWYNLVLGAGYREVIRTAMNIIFKRTGA